MSQNTDSFPTPRGALSPDGVTAAAPQPHAFIATTGLYETPPRCGCGRLVQDAIHAVPLGVPGYAGAKGAVPEPQGPTTEAGRDLLAHSVQYNPLDADKAVIAAKILAIEAEARRGGFRDGSASATAAYRERLAEARAAAPPDIDVERLAEAMRVMERQFISAWSGLAEQIAAEYRRLASTDATRREPSGE